MLPYWDRGGIPDQSLRQHLGQASQGTGTFRCLHDLVHEEDLAETWRTCPTDRQLGRARALLTEEGIRVASARTPPRTPRSLLAADDA